MTSPSWPPPPPTRPRRGLPWIPITIATVTVLLALGTALWVLGVLLFGLGPDPRDDSGVEVDATGRFEIGPGALLVPGAAADDLPDMVGVMTTFDHGRGTHVIRSTFDGDVTWRSGVAADQRDRLLAVIDDIVLLDHEGSDEVTAIRLADGREAWTARLPIDPTCGECIELVGDAIVARDLDGNLTAVDPRSGELLWHRPGAGIGTTVLPVVVQGTLVVGQPLPDGEGFELVVLDPADGAEQGRLRPECSVTVDGLAYDDVLEADAFVEPIPGTGDVAVVFGHRGRCVQRWDTATGEQAWGVALDVGYSALGATASERHLAFSAPGAAIVVDLEDGSHEERPVAPEHSAEPLAIVEGEVLLAGQVPDIGTAGTVGLLGWDLDSDEGPWSLPGTVPAPYVLADEVRPGGHGVIGDSGVTVIVPGDDGVDLVSVGPLVDGEEPELRTAAVDLPTGTPVDERSVALRVDPERLDPILLGVHGVVDGRVAITAAGIPQLVDIATGEVVAHWPVPG